MSGRVVSDIQTQAEGESLCMRLLRYNVKHLDEINLIRQTFWQAYLTDIFDRHIWQTFLTGIFDRFKALKK
jgi:repressor of nif and glnA expression